MHEGCEVEALIQIDCREVIAEEGSPKAAVIPPPPSSDSLVDVDVCI